MRIPILAALVSLAPLCCAKTSSSPLLQAKTAFERYVPSRNFHDYATVFGDLNDDRITDFVTFIGYPNYNDRGVENLKIAVFFGAKDNTFSIYEVPSAILGHEGASHILRVKGKSIFLHRDGSGGCCSHWVEEFQFKMHDRQLALIGPETAVYHPEGITDPDYGVSANLLTGRIIKWTATGKSRRENRTTVPTLKSLLLKNFNYDSFTDKWSKIL